MSVKIRLKRFGRKNRAFWRINAVDSRRPRDGRVLEELGYYDPIEKNAAKAIVVDKARVEFWLKSGAQPSPTVEGLLRRATDSATLPPPERKRKPTFVAPPPRMEAPVAPAAPAPKPAPAEAAAPESTPQVEAAATPAQPVEQTDASAGDAAADPAQTIAGQPA